MQLFFAVYKRILHAAAGSREDQFRIKAIERAMHKVAGWGAPLTSASHVEALRLGPKSSEKVVEILEEGRCRRVEALAQEERRQARAL